MRSFSLLVMLAACGGGGSVADKEAKLCKHLGKLCGADVVEKSCAVDLAELGKPMAESYGKTLDCGIEATSCAELAGCFVGGMGQTFDRWAKQFEKGAGKMLDPDKKDRKDRKDRTVDPKDPRGNPDLSNPFDDDHKDPFAKDATILQSCTEFKSTDESFNHERKLAAAWSGCKDRVVRTLSCKTFIDDLKCDCLEDGTTKWSFSSTNPPLANRADAERVAGANCQMGFGK